LRLAIASRKGAILALTVLLLMLNFQQLGAQQYGEDYIVHRYIGVRAGDLVKYEFYACAGCRVSISFDFVAGPDIIFRALDPYGKEIYPRSKVIRLRWSFTAERPGTYVLEFDNTYSVRTDKVIDLVLSISSRSTATTVYETIPGYKILTATEYRTLTETLTVTTLSDEVMQILMLVAPVAFIAGIILTLLARRAKAQQA
jgi:hypothetical protein